MLLCAMVEEFLFRRVHRVGLVFTDETIHIRPEAFHFSGVFSCTVVGFIVIPFLLYSSLSFGAVVFVAVFFSDFFHFHIWSWTRNLIINCIHQILVNPFAWFTSCFVHVPVFHFGSFDLVDPSLCVRFVLSLFVLHFNTVGETRLFVLQSRETDIRHRQAFVIHSKRLQLFSIDHVFKRRIWKIRKVNSDAQFPWDTAVSEVAKKMKRQHVSPDKDQKNHPTEKLNFTK